MRRGAFVPGLVLLSVLPLAANLRAPHKVDGFVSGSLKTMELREAVTMLGEELRIVFPEFRPKLDPRTAEAAVSVRYRLENASSGPVTVPVKFLAVEMSGLRARLDGRELAVSLCPDAPEKSECLVRLTRHRAAFIPGLYTGFLAAVRKAAGLEAVPEGEWLSRLEGGGLETASFQDLFYPAFGRMEGEADFRRAGLELDLKPGVSVLEVEYKQRLFVDERGHGYFAGWPGKGFTAFDYLLYPAASWPRGESFRLTVEVEVPDYRRKRLLGTSWRKAFARTNPALKEERSKKPRRILRGEFSELPADILTVVVWFDAEAPGYLSPGR